MGQSETKLSDVEATLNKLTDAERKKLDAIFSNREEHEGPPTTTDDYLPLKALLGKHFSPELAEAQVSTFRNRRQKSTVVKGNSNDLIKMDIVNVTHASSDTVVDFVLDSLKNPDGVISLTTFKQFMSELLKFLSSHATASTFRLTEEAHDSFASSFLPSDAGDQLRSGDLRKRILELSLSTELFSSAYRHIFYDTPLTVAQESIGFTPVLLPELEIPPRTRLDPNITILTLLDVLFLNSFLPLTQQHKWRFLYSSNLHGESFSKFSSSILNQGPLLVIVKDRESCVFGGYVSTNLQHSSQYQGDEKSFLFRVSPEYGVYHSTGYNNNFVYMNVGQETMPNGLGMGGKHDYFGLWLSTEFGEGHSKARPTSTTFGSPRLSGSEEFRLDVVEAWAVGNEPKDEEEEDEEQAASVIDKNPEAVAILRAAGKDFASDGYRESERASTQPEVTALHNTHDLMDPHH